jgi:hypothetical protein
VLLKHKSEARQKLIDFITLHENQYNTKVKIIRSDNGPEFLMPDFYSSKGIIHQTSCVETPQQNCRVERKHQHPPNVVRALLFQSHLPKHFWSYAVLHSTYKYPFEMPHNFLPDLQNLKVFGSLTYVATLQAH